MARLDVYRPPTRTAGYLLDVQANLLRHLTTRAVIPLVPTDRLVAATALNPVFEVAGQPVVLATQAIFSMAPSELRHPVSSLNIEHDFVVRALDTLFLGF